MRPVLVCTAKRGVFYGNTDASPESIVREKVVSLKGARMAIRWGTTGGVAELAEKGPNSKSKIGSRADVCLNDVTAVFECTDVAMNRWESA